MPAAADTALAGGRALLLQGEPEFDRLKREVEEVKSHQRGLEGGSYRSAAELERHRAALADAAIEEQIEVQTAFRETGQRLQRIYDHRRETELNMARREQEMKQLSSEWWWAGASGQEPAMSRRAEGGCNGVGWCNDCMPSVQAPGIKWPCCHAMTSIPCGCGDFLSNQIGLNTLSAVRPPCPPAPTFAAADWKGTVVQIITQLEDTLKLAAPLAGLVAGSEDRAPGDSSEGPDLEAGGQHLGAAAGSGADADAARALVHAVQSVTQQVCLRACCLISPTCLYLHCCCVLLG